jgi:hypothetical protein
MSKSYSEKLKDPRWQKKRLEVLEAKNWRCECCGETEKTLNVHHIIYRKNANPWDYELDEFKVYCESCHLDEHDREEIFKEHLLLITKDGLGVEDLFWLAHGIATNNLRSLEEVLWSIESRIKILKEVSTPKVEAGK